MKKVLVTLSSIVVAVALFTVVAYGSSWINFNGEDQIDQSSSDVAEILEILRQVHDEKELTEEQLAELEALKIQEIAELREEIVGLENDVDNLNDENETLKTDNATLTTDLNLKTSQVEELETTVENLNGTIAGLQTDIETHKGTIAAQSTQIKNLTDANSDLTDQNTNLKTELAAEKADNSENNKYIAHLEGQLEIANTKVAEHSTTTKNALKEARTYINSAE